MKHFIFRVDKICGSRSWFARTADRAKLQEPIPNDLQLSFEAGCSACGEQPLYHPVPGVTSSQLQMKIRRCPRADNKITWARLGTPRIE